MNKVVTSFTERIIQEKARRMRDETCIQLGTQIDSLTAGVVPGTFAVQTAIFKLTARVKHSRSFQASTTSFVMGGSTIGQRSFDFTAARARKKEGTTRMLCRKRIASLFEKAWRAAVSRIFSIQMRYRFYTVPVLREATVSVLQQHDTMACRCGTARGPRSGVYNELVIICLTVWANGYKYSLTIIDTSKKPHSFPRTEKLADTQNEFW